jgi:hypothetical protein
MITAAEKTFPQDPRWMATLRFATSVVLKQSATIIGDTEVSKDFDENSLFVEVPRLLVAAGQDGVARQFFRDVSWRLEGQYKGVLSAFVSLHLAAAAKAIDYRDFELARLSEGWEAMKASSDSRSDDEDNLADVAVFAALTSGAELPDYTRRVLTFAEDNVQFVKEKWSELLPDMVRLWVALGELPKARSLVVEKASTVSASMDLYPPILDKIISDRKKRPLTGLRIDNQLGRSTQVK